MKAVVAITLVAALASYGYSKYQQRIKRLETAVPALPAVSGDTPTSAAVPARCDGRTHCSQMRSCEEAKFFLKNCPGTQMDGDRDGTPCEEQWCTGPLAK